MRKLFVLAASIAIAVPAFAQQSQHSNTITGFLSEPQLYGGRGGTHFDVGFGAALDHAFNDRLSTELSVTRQQYRYAYAYFVGTPTTFRQDAVSYPIDANVSYHFATESRWQPYIGGGLRYVRERLEGINLVTGDPFPAVHFTSLAPEVSGGVYFRLRPNLMLRLDAKQILGARSREVVDPDLKVSAGIGWRF